MKKIISLTLSILLIFSAVAYAADLPASEDPVIYSVKDLSSENLDTIEITQSDIDEGNWNVDALGDVAPIVYEDFPMEMEKYITEGATLNIVFKYLKTVPENGTASFTVTDRMTNEVYYTTELNADNYIIELNALPLDKVYNVRISESFDGTEKNYDGVIQTYRTAADMPYNVYIGENTNINENIIAEYVTIAESVITEDFVKVDENGNEIIYSYAPDVEKTTVTPENLASLYNSLEDNKLYCIQTDAPVDGISEHFMGYFSTTPELESYGIFEPAYKFQLARDYSDIMTISEPASHPCVTASYLQNNAYTFTYLHDEDFTLPKSNTNEDDFQIISFKFPETGEYTIRTYGTIATSAEYWIVNSSGTPTFSRVIRGDGSNFVQTTNILAGQTRYWVIYFDTASSGRSTISISYNDATDIGNSICEMESSTSNQVLNDTLYADAIDYTGDVDVYYINNSEPGKFAYQVSNQSSLQAINSILCERTTANSIIWHNEAKKIEGGKTRQYHMNLLGAPAKYFVMIKSPLATNSGIDYTVEIKSSTRPDPYEPNNSFDTAMDLTPYSSGNHFEGSLTELTLHKGDVDYFKITAPEEATLLEFALWGVDDMQYNMKLYKKTGSSYTLLTVADADGYLAYEDVQPNTTYYIKIDNEGMGDNAYTAVLETHLYWAIYD